MIYTILAEGFEEIEAICVIDILKRAQIGVCTVSASGSKYVRGAHDITVEADCGIDDIKDNYDMIFLPGGYPGYVNLKENPRVRELICETYRRGKKIAAICAAPSVLGHLGILKDKTACCFPGFEEELNCKEVSYDDVVCCDNIITSRGAGTAHELGFKLVEIFKGFDTAVNLRKTMVYKDE